MALSLQPRKKTKDGKSKSPGKLLGKSKGFFGQHWSQGGCGPEAKQFVRECVAFVEMPGTARPPLDAFP